MAAFEEKRVAIVEPNRWLPMLYVIPLLTLAALVIGVIAGPSSMGIAERREFGSFVSSMVMLTMFASCGVALAIRKNLAPRRSTDAITADLEGLRSGALFVPRGKIKNAYLVEQPDGQCRLRLVGKRLVPLLDVTLPTRARGTELLRALELDVLHRVLESPALLLVPGNRLRTTFLVGADGVVVQGHGIGFIPYDKIASVAIDSEGGVLRLRSGEEIRYIGFGLTPGAITERIREGLEAHRRADAPASAQALVARSGRPAKEWLSALRALAESKGDYRSMAVPDDALWTLAEDHSAEPTARTGAAIVLRQRLGEPGRARIEATAAASAEPRIRIALEAAAKGESEGLEEALEQWEPERAREA
jgi:hypothetical protein